MSEDGEDVTVNAELLEGNVSPQEDVYLLALDTNISVNEPVNSQPIASGQLQKSKISFEIAYEDSMLFQKFVIAYKLGNMYMPISNTHYITNPEVLASYTDKGAEVTSKKGLQIEDYAESLTLGTKHAVLNWTASMLLTDNPSNGIPYEYRGVTYYFNPEVIEHNDAMVAGYTKAGVRVTVILLLPNDNITVTTPMRYEGSSTANYSSFNTSSEEGCRMFEAMMSFLAGHYNDKERLVNGWILGNEVNSPGIWNYAGGTELDTYIQSYSDAFRICYNAAKSTNKYANVYISLDHNWNHDIDGASTAYFSTKSVLDSFYAKMNEHGQIVFQIAYHCYPQNLPNPSFWNDPKATDSVDTTYVTFRNLHVLTDYVKSFYGTDYTIMLSEQSFNSNKGEAIQAAAYAYAYYMCESNDMIEAFIYGRQYDHPIELAEGCRWGLSNSSHDKRLIWDVFQFIDTRHSLYFTDPLVNYTDLTQWEQLAGFDRSIYQKMPSILAQTEISGAISASSSSVELYWCEVSAADGYEVYRNDQLIATITDPTVLGYADTGLTAGTTYSYKIRSFAYAPTQNDVYSKSKVYGPSSIAKKVQVTAGQTYWSSQPSVIMGNHIILFWNPQDNVTGYEISRSDSLNGKYKTITYTNSSSYDDNSTISGNHYYYKVRAYVNVNGTNYFGEYSQPLSAQSKIQLYGSCVDGNISLSWTTWPSAEKYQIYCAPKGSDDFVRLKTVTDLTYETSQYKDDLKNLVDFDPDVTYQFKICAVFDNDTKSPDSNIIEVTYCIE